jgi:hypothetical protein
MRLIYFIQGLFCLISFIIILIDIIKYWKLFDKNDHYRDICALFAILIISICSLYGFIYNQF